MRRRNPGSGCLREVPQGWKRCPRDGREAPGCRTLTAGPCLAALEARFPSAATQILVLDAPCPASLRLETGRKASDG